MLKGCYLRELDPWQTEVPRQPVMNEKTTWKLRKLMDRRKQASSETLQPVGGGMGGRGIQALELSCSEQLSNSRSKTDFFLG